MLGPNEVTGETSVDEVVPGSPKGSVFLTQKLPPLVASVVRSREISPLLRARFDHPEDVALFYVTVGALGRVHFEDEARNRQLAHVDLLREPRVVKNERGVGEETEEICLVQEACDCEIEASARGYVPEVGLFVELDVPECRAAGQPCALERRAAKELRLDELRPLGEVGLLEPPASPEAALAEVGAAPEAGPVECHRALERSPTRGRTFASTNAASLVHVVPLRGRF